MSDRAEQPSEVPPQIELTTLHGKIVRGDSLAVLADLPDESVDLIVTSPPFGLVRKKEYGNVHADDYVGWFEPFGREFHRVLKQTGSLVLDIGGAWNAGTPTRHLYHFELLVKLCREHGFHLAQEFYWWNPSKLPSPAEWVNVRRIRVKDAVNTVWWLSKSQWPKADNRRVLQRYSDSMTDLLENGYKAKLRPSGHKITTKFSIDNGGAIPPNLLAIANTESNSGYLRYCKDHGLKPHPARFPAELPEFFVRMLTNEGDRVIDPFAGSCVTGEVCERLKRAWTCIELRGDYVEAAKGRFIGEGVGPYSAKRSSKSVESYRVPRPSSLWDEIVESPLHQNGGAKASELPEDTGDSSSDRNAA
jgi:site-specific DNA-methyltransferase (cytosine-N4-specific)